MLLGDFYKQATNPEVDKRYSKLVCSQSTFYRSFKQYGNTGILPASDDHRVRVGAPQIIENNNLQLLNVDINRARGSAGKNEVLAKNVDLLREELQSERDLHSCAKTPSTSTT